MLEPSEELRFHEPVNAFSYCVLIDLSYEGKKLFNNLKQKVMDATKNF